MARLWRTAGLYLPFFCSLISGAESAQCSSGVTQKSVTTPDDVEDLISLMDCTGGGTFNVAWTGRIAIGQTIEVTGNNKLTITASSSASPSEEVGALAAEPQTDGVLASNPDVRLFLVSGESATLSLNSLLLEGGTALNGGAVSALSSTPGGAVVNVVDCDFRHNKAAAFGGAIYSMNSEVNVVGSRFTNNSASDGGAIYFVESSMLSVSGHSFFTGNVALRGGGAVSVATPPTTTAALALEGGASAGISFEKVEFSSNVADSGGAFMLSSVGLGERKLDGCTFIENAAAGKGGAMYLLIGPGVVDVQDTLFEGNHAEESGGALFFAAGALSVDNTAFVSNKAGAEGLAVTAASSGLFAEIKFLDAVFLSNTLLCPLGQYGRELENSRDEDNADDETALDNTCRFDLVCSGCSSGGCDDGGGGVPEGVSALGGISVPVCEDLPEGTVATSKGATVEVLELEAGHYRTSNESLVVLECYREEACAGGSDASSYCEPGYKGHYCAECAEGYAPGVGYSCHRCQGSGSQWGAGLAIGAAVLAMVVLVVADLVRVVDCTVHEDTDSVEEEEETNVLERAAAFCTYFFRRTLPCQAIKIVIVVWQITLQFAEASGNVFPEAYEDFLMLLHPANFDVGSALSISCVLRMSFYGRLVLVTLFPLALLGGLGLTRYLGRARNEGSEAAVLEVDNKHASAALFVAFFSYSPVVFTLFRTFSCDYDVGDAGDDGRGYLRADYGLECATVEHGIYSVYAVFMLSVYAAGVPAVLAWFLARNREHLTSGASRRDRMGHLRGWSGVWRAYRPSRYYYEIVECARRLALASASALGSPSSPRQIAVVLFLAVAFLFVSECLSPFQTKADAGLYRWGNAVVIGSIFAALLSRSGVLSDAGSSSLAGWLIAGNGVMAFAVAVLFAARVTEWNGHRKAIAFPATRQQAESFAL